MVLEMLTELILPEVFSICTVFGIKLKMFIFFKKVIG